MDPAITRKRNIEGQALKNDARLRVVEDDGARFIAQTGARFCAHCGAALAR